MNNFRIFISNQRISPYELGKEDYLQVKVVLNNNEKLSYIKDIPVDLYLNINGIFVNYSSGITNEKGISNLYYNTGLISQTISNCLGYVKVIINSEEYVSNTIRFNFIGDATITVQELELYPAKLILYNQNIILM